MKKYIAVLMIVATLIVSYIVPTSAVVDMAGDNYGTFSGYPTGYSYTISGEYRTRYYSSETVRYVKNIAGHRTAVPSTKVIHVYGYDSNTKGTKYSTITTVDYYSKSTVNSLSIPRTSNWNVHTAFYAYKMISATYSPTVTVYVTYENVFSGTTYMGFPDLYNIT